MEEPKTDGLDYNAIDTKTGSVAWEGIDGTNCAMDVSRRPLNECDEGSRNKWWIGVSVERSESLGVQDQVVDWRSCGVE